MNDDPRDAVVQAARDFCQSRAPLSRLHAALEALDAPPPTPAAPAAGPVSVRVAEIERLNAAIAAAIGEIDRGKPMSALNFLLNAKEGLG